MSEAIFEDLVLTQTKKQVLDYWFSLIAGTAGTAGADIPLFGDFDILELSLCMPNIVLFEVRTEPRDFYYRLIGSNVDQHNTDAFTGRVMSELSGKGPGSKVWDFFSSVIDTGEPALREMPYVGRNKDFERIEIMALPLRGDARKNDHILVVTDYFPRDARGLQAPRRGKGTV